MSISLGIYDIFANMVPGFVYLFLFGEVAKLLGYPSIAITDIDNGSVLIVLAFLAYLAGHVMDSVARLIWVKPISKMLYKALPEERAHAQFQAKYPELKAKFTAEQAPLLFSVVRYRKTEVSNEIERNRVVCFMLRNVSFALLLLFIFESYLLYLHWFSLFYLLAAIFALIGSIISFQRGELYYVLYYRLTFHYAVIFGKTLDKVLKAVKPAEK